MKIFEAITAERLRQIAPKTRFARIEAHHDVSPIPHLPEEHFEWKIGATVFTRFSGPIKAREQMMRQAQRFIAQEIYGELMNDLIELQRILLEDQYRGPGDPAMDAIDAILRKMRGEN